MRKKNNHLGIYASIAAISSIQALQHSIPPVLEQIAARYSHVNVSLVQSLMTIPSLLAMVIALVSGWLVTRISKKKLLLFAGISAAATCLLPLVTDSFPLLLISRTLYGVPLGLAAALNTAVVADFFEGEARVTAMGIQSVAIGLGIMLVSTVSGWLGRLGFRLTYLLGLLGFASAIVLLLCLPDTGKATTAEGEHIHPTKAVWQTAVFTALEFLFLITFNTNIALHMSGELAGDSAAAGLLTGMYAVAQIPAGLLLKYINRCTGRYTVPFAMASFCVGGILLILFPESLPLLALGAFFCGFSQGAFVPQAMVEAANAVPAAASALAGAFVTSGMCIGQLISPAVLNGITDLVFGEANTTRVYLVAVAGMLVSVICVIICKAKNKE